MTPPAIEPRSPNQRGVPVRLVPVLRVALVGARRAVRRFSFGLLAADEVARDQPELDEQQLAGRYRAIGSCRTRVFRPANGTGSRSLDIMHAAPPPEDDDPRTRGTRRRLLMRSEVGAESPVWSTNGGPVMLEDLHLSANLRESLEGWALVAWESDDSDLRAEGLRLLEQVSIELGPSIEVVWDDD